jgi:hypothetical protein
MPKGPENGQNLVKEVQKYKGWNLTVFCWFIRAMLTKKIQFEKKKSPKSDVYGLNYILLQV